MKNAKITLALILMMAASLVVTGKGLAQTTTSTISLSNSVLSQSGIPGATLSYSVTVTNEDAVNVVTVTLDKGTSGKWTTDYFPAGPFTLQPKGTPGDSQVVAIYVQIPADAPSGTNDVFVMTFKNPATSESLPLTVNSSAQVPVPTTAPNGRPLVVVSGYDTGGSARAGQEFTLKLEFANVGQYSATNILVSFDSPDFLPRSTGGVRAISVLDAGKTVTISQNFLVGSALAWQNVGSLPGTFSYEDASGKAYSGTFNLTINISGPTGSGSYATSTPNIPKRPQLVVSDYKTDVDPLQPGSIFTINMDVRNLGQADASNVTMVLGGGVNPGGDTGTPGAGGVSGAGGELTNFAPLGSSNVMFIGNLAKDAVVTIPVKLIVNVSTTPGAYSLKLSFVYVDTRGNRLVDDQVITLLVYSLPQVEIGYYRDPGMFNAGMMTMLPLQVTNLGKKSYILGNMKVTAENADITNNVALVGALDPGGYYTLDVNFMPYNEGPLDVKVAINYTDDFNMPRFIEQTLQVEVGPAMDMGPTPSDGSVTPGKGDGIPIDGGAQAPETFLQKVWRFVKGLLGLDSGSDTNAAPTEIPTDSIPIKVGPKG